MKTVLFVIAVSLTLVGCQSERDSRMAQGAVIGGTGGAIVGGLVSRNVGGAVIGGVAGAAAGAIIADSTRPRHRPRECYWDYRINREVCRYR